jgi:alpha-ketoglutarate-dependent taurine dioxygenase
MDISTITVADLETVNGQPLVLNIDAQGIRAKNWISEQKHHINRLLEENGALLIRGLKIHGSKQFGGLLTTVFDDELLQYTYRSTPRTEFRGNIYSATEYPANEVIPQHNENAYSHSWPNRIGFMCLVEPQEGGATPISCSQYIYEHLSDPIKKQFEEKGIMYVRNYSDMDLPWQEVFQTQDKAEVEAFCQANGLTFEWLEGGLRTKQVNPATAVHPQTGQKLWFNQAHLFHVTSLGEEMSETLKASLGEENVPRNTYYGDGSPIEPEYLKEIRHLYEHSKIVFKWQKDDLMLLDNMRFTHGRETFKGERKILVGMACPNQH